MSRILVVGASGFYSDLSRILVVGASGFIGRHVVENLIRQRQHLVSGTYNSHRVKMDGYNQYQVSVTDTRGLGEVFRLVKPDIVVLLAAVADVVECERDPLRAAEVNVKGAQNVVTLCGQYEAKLVLLSTEYVFDGESGNYKEDVMPAPTTHYGRTKWGAELTVARYSGPWGIIRTSLVYGWNRRAGKENLVTRVINNLRLGRPVYGFSDQYRSPVYVEDVAEGIVRVAEEDYIGVSHLAGPEWLAMDQFVLTVAEQFGLDSDLVRQTPSTDQKPGRLGLDSTQSIMRLGWQPLDVISGLQDMRIERRQGL